MTITASANLLAHIAGRSTSLAMLWLVTRTDGQVFGFTDHDRDIESDGVTYVARYGFDPSAMQWNAGLAVGNAELSAAFNGDSFTEADLTAGRWDYADVRVRFINWRVPADGVLKQLRGWLGEVRHDGFRFTAELRSLTDLLHRARADAVKPSCSARFCDARCGLTEADFTAAATVTGVTSRRVFVTDVVAAAGHYIGGVVRWLTGANAGLSMEVKASDASGGLTLFLPMGADIQIGDTAGIVDPCDKSFETCRLVYDNVVHFRGFHFVPLTDAMLRQGGVGVG